jgi:broad specificity phosphatase PhoE
MSLRLYLLRHGETVFSQSGGFCGALDAELTESGQAMAQAFADAYKNLPWQAIYCSPMKRTQSTAAPIVKAVGLAPQLRDGLKEIDYGKWEGKARAEVEQAYGEDYAHWSVDPAWSPPTGGESSVQIASRAMAVIAEIEEKYGDGNVLVVSHKATLRIILSSLLGIDLGRYRDRIDYPAASISVVKFGQYGPMLEILGDRTYMPAALRDRKGT